MARKDRNKHIRRRSGVPLRSGVNLAKLRILSETMIPVPGYSDLFLGDLPSLQEVLKVLPREIWTDALSQIAGFLANPVLDTTSINSIVIDALGPNLRFMAQKLLNENPRSHLLYLFPVLVALELAYVHAPVQVDGWDKDDTNYHIFRAIYLVHELLSERTHVLVESDPAGVIAGIIERSYCGRPANMAIRGYGIWRWQHAHIDDDIVQRRLMFDAALRRERGIGIADLVAICSLVQLTCTGKASMGLFATRHRISRREVNLTQGGQQVANTVLDVLAESPDSFATLCRPLLSARGVVQPDLSPIEHIPILRDGDGFSVMSPLHVSLRGLWLPVQTMGETGLSLFGDVQEAYLHGLLSALYGDRYFKVPKKTSEPSADGMIWFDDGVIVIECKATRTPKASRYMIRTDAQLNKDLMRRDFQRATIQLTATCSDIVSGKLHHDACKRPRVIVPVILCFDVVPMSVFASDVLGAILSLEVPAYDALRVLQPQLLLIDDIERLTSANAGALLETCKRRHGTVHRFESIERYFRHVPGAKMRMIETLIQLIRTDVSTLFQDAMAAEDKKAGK